MGKLLNCKYYRLAGNIKALREMYGETQEDLGQAIGVGKSTISEYEHGDIPERDNLIKITKHYRVPVEMLLGDDLSNLKSIKTSIVDSTKIEKLYMTMFPFLEDATENIVFEKALAMHKSLTQSPEKWSMDDADVKECLCLYEKASQDGCLESVVNQLSLMMLLGCIFAFLTAEMLENINNIKSSTPTIKELAPFILVSFDERRYHQDTQKMLEKMKETYLAEYRTKIYFNLYKLKRSKYVELSDYYMALLYMLGIAFGWEYREDNTLYGTDLLGTLSHLGNSYAENYLKVVVNA